MTRFVVDCGVVLRIAAEQIDVPESHELLAPTLLRSQTLSALHEAVHRGELARDVARDRVETYDAEHIALTQLQADAFVTLDARLARRVKDVVRTATIEELRER